MFELRLQCPEDVLDDLGDALDESGALSISIEDADAGTVDEQALFGEPGTTPAHESWQRSKVLALFATEAQAQAAALGLSSGPVHQQLTILGVVSVPDQDWVRLTQSQFAAVEIMPDFWIVPSWHETPPAARRIIRLDPGLAFGTGTHPTTRMCLRWIAGREDQFTRVLDYGCGSGILAIGAALYGAKDVDAVDIDEAAVESARANAAANAVSIHTGLPDVASGSYDLVLANILASPLKVLAPLLCARVAPGGSLVLAGILDRQAQELMQAYRPHGELAVADAEEGWILMSASF